MMKRYVTIAKFISCIAIFAMLSSAPVFAGEDNLTGTLTMTEDGMMLKTSGGTFSLIGKSIPDTLVGKKVKVNGTIMEVDDEEPKVISIDSFEEVK